MPDANTQSTSSLLLVGLGFFAVGAAFASGAWLLWGEGRMAPSSGDRRVAVDGDATGVVETLDAQVSEASLSAGGDAAVYPSADLVADGSGTGSNTNSPVLPGLDNATQNGCDLATIERGTIELFRRASPSVVFITKLSIRADPLRHSVTEQAEGTGSGFVWDQQGHVVTNYHVIAGADGARVTMSDQTTWPARLVGYVAEKDIAVLRIETPVEQLTPLPVASSHDLQVGQSVFAIGNPFGLDHTLSSGVISGLGREIMSIGRRPIQDVIQTDAAINPGNSGGPLLNSFGQLIGMNTAIYSPSGAYAGIGFAVPVDTIRRVVPQLIQHGRVVRPGLGVVLLPDAQIQRLGLRGVSVRDVVPNSPAARAGLLPARYDRRTGRILWGDLILAIDGEPVQGGLDLYRALDRREVGTTVQLSIQRGAQRMDVPVELGAVLAQ